MHVLRTGLRTITWPACVFLLTSRRRVLKIPRPTAPTSSLDASQPAGSPPFMIAQRLAATPLFMNLTFNLNVEPGSSPI